MVPKPLQRGHSRRLVSLKVGFMRCRESSKSPNWEILPIWILARSIFMASLSCLSTSKMCFLSSMSIKSMTIRPPKSRKRNCRPISSAAWTLVLKAVISTSFSRVERPELMSMATKASVGSMTKEPPARNKTLRSCMDSIWFSIW